MTDASTRLAAALADRYRIERELGEGGMAVVYLAEDLRHQRQVAIKVLKPELAAVVGSERFLAEIRTTANLQHPGILPLHDSGEADSFLYYVMPYVEGESLRARLDREHQLSVDEAVRIATDVAEALEYAHGHGVIHRDVKPANILLVAGRPLIADFGIALAVGVAGGARLTETGLSLGTPQYMSPEQATGDAHVGPASDVYALGCVLFEMLVGQAPHTGSTPQAILGRVITEPPPRVTKDRRAVPANVEGAILKALEKVPADRFSTAGAFAAALRDERFRYGESGGVGQADGVVVWKRRAVVAAGMALALLVVAAWGVFRSPPKVPSSPVMRFESPFREGQAPLGASVAQIPDGSGVVYAGPSEDSTTSQLWIRRWNDLASTRIPGTDMAQGIPSVSPAGDEVAYVTGNPGALRVTVIAGGQTHTLAERVFGPIAWAQDGWIYFRAVANGLSRVRPTSGDVEALTELSPGEVKHEQPFPIPGGRWLLFTVAGTPNGADAKVYVLDLQSEERRFVIVGNTPKYAAPGYLLFSTAAGTLMAAPFDPVRAVPTGDAAMLVEGLGFDLDHIAMDYDVSENGSLTYWAAGGRTEFQFVWVSRQGKVTPIAEGERFSVSSEGNVGWRLSPDGRRIAFRRTLNGNEDIWIEDLPDGSLSRLTSSEDNEAVATWTPDGRSVIYRRGPLGEGRLWSRRADGTGEPRLLFDGFNASKGVMSPDEQWLVIRRAGVVGDERARDIYALRLGVDSTAAPLIASPDFWEQAPAFSPDGRWLAYSSNETGRHEIVVRPFPNVDDGKVLVSKTGGIQPVWAHNGHELFFADPATRDLKVAEVGTTGSTFRVTRTSTLFRVPRDIYFATSGNMDFYDVPPNDDRFLMARVSTAGGGSASLVLVVNFYQELNRLTPR